MEFIAIVVINARIFLGIDLFGCYTLFMPSQPTEIDPKLLEILVCPVSKGALRYDAGAQELVCEQSGLAYPVRDGIPIMLADEARKLGAA